jgi:hypothetical protein
MEDLGFVHDAFRPYYTWRPRCPLFVGDINPFFPFYGAFIGLIVIVGTYTTYIHTFYNILTVY